MWAALSSKSHCNSSSALSYPFLSDYFLIEMEFPDLDWLGQVYVDEKALELLVLLVTCPVLCWGGTPGLGV